MAIQYVGGQTQSITASTATNTTINFSLTGGLASTPAADDIVIVGYGTGSTVNATIGVNTAGYTEVAELYISDTYDANLSVSWKRMGSTPDTSVQVGPTGATADGGFVTIQVFRGVDTTTALDVTSTTATGGNAGIPNPAAIVPTNVNTDIIVIGATASTGGVTFTASYLSNFLTGSNTAATNDITMGAGWVNGPAAGVSYDPAAFTVTGSANTQSWATVTMALREQPTIVTGAALISPAATTVAAGNRVALGAAQVSPEATVAANGERIALGAALVSPAATTTADGILLLSGAASILPAATTTAAGQRLAFGAAVIAPAATTVAAGERIALGAAAASPATTVAADGQRLALGAATASAALSATASATVVVSGGTTYDGAASILPALSVVVAGERVAIGSASIAPALSVAAAGERVAIGSALVEPTLSATSSVSLLMSGAAAAAPELSSSIAVSVIYSASIGISVTSASTAAGRLRFQPQAPQAENWTLGTPQAENWVSQGAQLEAWSQQAANGETWAPATAGSKTWTQAV